MAPETFLARAGAEAVQVAYVHLPGVRQTGGMGKIRTGCSTHELQVILKPPPENVQELYLESLFSDWHRPGQHDISSKKTTGEAPTLSAWEWAGR